MHSHPLQRLLPLLALALACAASTGGCGYLTRWPSSQVARLRLSELLAAEQGPTSLWGDGWLRIEKGGERVSFAAEILIALPDRVRLTAFGLFDRPEAYLASDGATLRLYLPTRNAFYEGPAEGPALARLLGLPPLELAELLGFLAGRLPVEPGARFELSADRWHSRWIARTGPLAQEERVFFSSTGSRLLGFKRTVPGGRLRVRFSEFRRPEGVGRLQPHRVEIRSPEAGASLRLSLREIEMNPPADGPGLFTLTPPPGAPVRPFGEAALLLGRRGGAPAPLDVDRRAAAVVRPTP